MSDTKPPLTVAEKVARLNEIGYDAWAKECAESAKRRVADAKRRREDALKVLRGQK